MATYRVVEPYNYNRLTSAEDFPIWMAQFSSYLFTSEIRDLTDETQNSMAAHSLIQVGGKDIVKLLMSFGEKWNDRKYEEMIETAQQ